MQRNRIFNLALLLGFAAFLTVAFVPCAQALSQLHNQAEQSHECCPEEAQTENEMNCGHCAMSSSQSTAEPLLLPTDRSPAQIKTRAVEAVSKVQNTATASSVVKRPSFSRASRALLTFKNTLLI